MSELKDAANKALKESKEDLLLFWKYLYEFGIKPVSKYVLEFFAKVLFASFMIIGALGFLVAHLLLLSDEYENFCKRISKFDVKFVPKD